MDGEKGVWDRRKSCPKSQKQCLKSRNPFQNITLIAKKSTSQLWSVFFSHFFGFLDMTKNSVFFIIFYHPKCTVFGSFLPFPLNKLHFILDFCLKHNTYFTFCWVFTPFSLFLWLAALKSRPTDYFKRGGWPHISLKKSSWALF